MGAGADDRYRERHISRLTGAKFGWLDSDTINAHEDGADALRQSDAVPQKAAILTVADLGRKPYGTAKKPVKIAYQNI